MPRSTSTLSLGARIDYWFINGFLLYLFCRQKFEHDIVAQEKLFKTLKQDKRSLKRFPYTFQEARANYLNFAAIQRRNAATKSTRSASSVFSDEAWTTLFELAAHTRNLAIADRSDVGSNEWGVEAEVEEVEAANNAAAPPILYVFMPKFLDRFTQQGTDLIKS